MDKRHARDMILQHLELRVGDEMAGYVARQIAAGKLEVPVIGGDARTGIAMRKVVRVRDLVDVQSISAAFRSAADRAPE